jgi:hypothetical protein
MKLNLKASVSGIQTPLEDCLKLLQTIEMDSRGVWKTDYRVKAQGALEILKQLVYPDGKLDVERRLAIQALEVFLWDLQPRQLAQAEMSLKTLLDSKNSMG